MRILILGGDGMLGHQLFKHLGKIHETKVTLREELEKHNRFGLFQIDNTYAGIDVRSDDHLNELLDDFSPQVVINAVAIIKQAGTLEEKITNIEINSVFPHRLAAMCEKRSARMVHISTDCVFSGRKGMYREKDLPDADNLYCRSKLLGEVDSPNCLTLRTSIIGHGLKRKTGLVDWLLQQNGKVRGYSNVIYSGFPTVEFATIISEYILPNKKLTGIYHVSSEPISKHEILCLIAKIYSKQIVIEPSGELFLNRSLDSSAFRSLTGYCPPPWPEMIEKMYLDYSEHKEIIYD